MIVYVIVVRMLCLRNVGFTFKNINNSIKLDVNYRVL